jgi:hypothetical protein
MKRRNTYRRPSVMMSQGMAIWLLFCNAVMLGCVSYAFIRLVLFV